MSDKKIEILPSDDEAATFRSVEGWVSREGMFFGSDERSARYSGSTHRNCLGCDGVIGKMERCQLCAEKNRQEKWNEMPVTDEDGHGMLFWNDNYYCESCDLFDAFIDENITDPFPLRIQWCDPVKWPELDLLDYFDESRNEDGDLPEKLHHAAEAVESLWAYIAKSNINIDLFYPAKRRPDLKKLDGWNYYKDWLDKL